MEDKDSQGQEAGRLLRRRPWARPQWAEAGGRGRYAAAGQRGGCGPTEGREFREQVGKAGLSACLVLGGLGALGRSWALFTLLGRICHQVELDGGTGDGERGHSGRHCRPGLEGRETEGADEGGVSRTQCLPSSLRLTEALKRLLGCTQGGP